ncbi:hypothetical protein B0T21DRAFT_52490 [Apiosordaria backusii]|uniref:Uncharacterized protein n=1 Tax=Apiosordaria backusii TaxID=314023 RepID=A0AA40AT16_9PEZI|nr:hypothetical protein B0T21DRAFT_52490 [Apiosordaria backusii]
MGKRAASTRPSETPQGPAAEVTIREKPTASHKRRASSTSQAGKPDSTMSTEKTMKSNLENKERAYVAASRRMDRSLEDRIKSAHQASQVHFERTGKHFRITRENVERGLWYDEIDDMPRHRINEHQMDAVSRARYQEVDAEFSQVFGRMMPQFPYPPQNVMAYHFSYQPYSVPQPLPPMTAQQHMSSGYPGMQQQQQQQQSRSMSYSAPQQQAPSPESMSYPYGLPPRQSSNRRSISPASSSSATSQEPAASVSPVSMGSSSSNPTSPESEIDSSAAEVLASTSRANSFDYHFTTSNSPMLAQGTMNYPGFATTATTTTTTSGPSSSHHMLTQVGGPIDPELHHSPPTAYFADLGFDDMSGSAYPDYGGFDFQQQAPLPPPRVVDNSTNNKTPPVAAPEENDWDDLINAAEFDEVAAQGAQGWARQG